MKRPGRVAPVLAGLAIAVPLALPANALSGRMQRLTPVPRPAAKAAGVAFSVDCSHLRHPATRGACGRFIANQQSRVFPSYSAITGIDLKDRCPLITYVIYDEMNFPYGTGVGGASTDCQVEMLSRYTLQRSPNGNFGPYETHELLHHFQMSTPVLASLTQFHPLFEATQAEAERLMGNRLAYRQAIRHMYDEIDRMRGPLERPSEGLDYCAFARTLVSEQLYLGNRHSIYEIYRRLQDAARDEPRVAQAEFDLVLGQLGGAKVADFLKANRCSAP